MSKGFGWAAVALAVTAMASTRGQWATPHVRVVFPDTAVVNAEVADTPTSRERGLMFRPDLAPSQGMLFVFEEPGYHPFWMKNCLISLDIIWLDEEGRVLSIAESVPPCRLPDCEPPCGSNAPTPTRDPSCAACDAKKSREGHRPPGLFDGLP
jgi:uncharacterized membrane protein (UPF0127 family)